jgi:flagellar P-ring protein precursor FlgI
MTLIEGGRDNQLVGYGLVVGLAGDGDSNSQSTLRSVANVLARYGIIVDSTQLKTKNAAAVMVTADIGAFLKSGSRIDVTVASLGDAKSLQGGVLLQTPLLGGDGRVYAVAQGPAAVGGFIGGAGGAGGATVQKNHPTVGLITNGAIIERDIPAQFFHDGAMTLQLHNPDFTSASRLASAVNAVWPGIAAPRDAATVDVHVPAAFQGKEVAFLANLGQIDVTARHRGAHRHQRAHRHHRGHLDGAYFAGRDQPWLAHDLHHLEYRRQSAQCPQQRRPDHGGFEHPNERQRDPGQLHRDQ